MTTVRRLTLNDDNAAFAIEQASAALTAGDLVAIPTETVYGLAADAANGTAVAKIFATKGRPSFNPLICHVTGIEMARRYGHLDDRAERLIAEFWPGPLTLVVPLGDGAPAHPLVTAGLPSIALRAPQGLAADIIEALGRAIAAPSANRSGRVSASRAEHVVEQLGDAVGLVLDGGPCRVGIESTIVSLTGPEPLLLRPGGISAAEIETVLGTRLARAGHGPVTAPGMLASHYAPSIPVRMDVTNVRPGEALLAFGPGALPGAADAGVMLNLSPSGDPIEAAANLFAFLAELDRSGAGAIAVMPIPTQGLGEALNDRLRRAAAPRPVPDRD